LQPVPHDFAPQRQLPGAIGYVRPHYLRDANVVKVEGTSPGKPGYRLVFAE
jgi:hypothetical protein